MDDSVQKASVINDGILSAAIPTGRVYLTIRPTREGFDIIIPEDVTLTEAAQRFIMQVKTILAGEAKVNGEPLEVVQSPWVSLNERLPKEDEWCAWWDANATREPTVGFISDSDIELWWEGYTHWMPLPAVSL